MGRIESALIVDDSQLQCQHAARICQAALQISKVATAFAAKDAIELLQTQPVDLALVDLEMPGMDGVELLTAIADQALAKSVIILSAKDPSLISSVGVMAEAGGLTVLGTIQKPLTAEILLLCTKQFIARMTKVDHIQKTEFNPCEQDIVTGMQEQQFVLHYQPKLTTQSLLLKGAEALVRWQHPQHGVIAPGYFVNRAEQLGLIDELTEYVFERALSQYKSWMDRGVKIRLSVNLSPSSLYNQNLASWIDECVQQYQVAPDDVTLEVTENLLLVDVAKAIQTLARLRLKGFRISIDDYGTGFANAEQLSRLPLTELKVDRSIVTGVAVNTQKQKILDSTIHLAKKLGFETVAEGIENIEDFKVLRQFDVDFVQGYYFARPMGPEKILSWLKSGLKQVRSSAMR